MNASDEYDLEQNSPISDDYDVTWYKDCDVISEIENPSVREEIEIHGKEVFFIKFPYNVISKKSYITVYSATLLD